MPPSSTPPGALSKTPTLPSALMSPGPAAGWRGGIRIAFNQRRAAQSPSSLRGAVKNNFLSLRLFINNSSRNLSIIFNKALRCVKAGPRSVAQPRQHTPGSPTAAGWGGGGRQGFTPLLFSFSPPLQITQLKIDNNPFAKGFRDTGNGRREKR